MGTTKIWIQEPMKICEPFCSPSSLHNCVERQPKGAVLAGSQSMIIKKTINSYK